MSIAPATAVLAGVAPEGFEDSVNALEETLQRAQKGVVGATTGDLAAFDAAWQAVNAG